MKKKRMMIKGKERRNKYIYVGGGRDNTNPNHSKLFLDFLNGKFEFFTTRSATFKMKELVVKISRTYLIILRKFGGYLTKNLEWVCQSSA